MFNPKKWKLKLPKHVQLIFEARPILRLIGIIGITLIMGMAFMLVAQGIVLGILRLSPYSRVAYRSIAFLAGIQYRPEEFEPFEIKGVHYFSILLGLIPSLLLMGAGFMFLVYMGLCGQNLFCPLLK